MSGCWNCGVDEPHVPGTRPWCWLDEPEWQALLEERRREDADEPA